MVWEASCKVHGGATWEGKGASFRASSGELEFGRREQSQYRMRREKITTRLLKKKTQKTTQGIII